jgi:predicted transcriptional regulator
VGEETRGLVDRLFGGQVAALVAHVARERTASPEDLARLRRLLADLDAEEEDD